MKGHTFEVKALTQSTKLWKDFHLRLSFKRFQKLCHVHPDLDILLVNLLLVLHKKEIALHKNSAEYAPASGDFMQKFHFINILNGGLCIDTYIDFPNCKFILNSYIEQLGKKVCLAGLVVGGDTIYSALAQLSYLQDLDEQRGGRNALK